MSSIRQCEAYEIQDDKDTWSHEKKKRQSKHSSDAKYAMQSQTVTPVVEEVGAGSSVGGAELLLSFVEGSTESAPPELCLDSFASADGVDSFCTCGSAAA
jgi:hypothetical protein